MQTTRKINQNITTQVALGAIGSGGLIAIKGEGSKETFLENPLHYTLTTTINSALFQPFGGALGKNLGLSNSIGGFIINSSSGGLQYGIEGTKIGV